MVRKENTWSCEEYEENGVEEAERVGDDHFVDDCGDDESQELGDEGPVDSALKEPTRVDVDEIVEPVMHDDVPFSVV